ncbi:MAG: two component transcriptional regulator, winged helix family, partial [Gemmatimonadetes bacterium]|nr:two component transcriptional regulator, winged helix family [Gemmatimonadota bacterium]
MHRILIAGLPDRLAGWLAQRLPGVAVEVAYTGDDALAVLSEGIWAALVIDASVEGLPADRVIRYARASSRGRSLPVVLTVDPIADAHDEEALRRMVSELRVDRILLAPLDRGELARHVGALIQAEAASDAGEPAPSAASQAPAAVDASTAAGTSMPQPAPAAAGMGAAGPPEAVSAALAAVWERAMPTIFARIETVEKAVKAMLATGSVPRELREDAEREAHRLAGALGTFGSHEGTRLARSIESALAAGAPSGRDVGGRVWQTVAALRREVESRAPAGTVPRPAPAAEIAAPAPKAAAARGGAPRVAVLS